MSPNPRTGRRLANAEKDLTALNKELAWEMSKAAVDVAGIIDPTPISDGIGAAMSLAEGDFVGAGLSLISMVPYVGDALGKSAKGARAAAKLAKLRKRIAAAAAELEALKKLEKAAEAAGRAKKGAKNLPKKKAKPCAPCSLKREKNPKISKGKKGKSQKRSKWQESEKNAAARYKKQGFDEQKSFKNGKEVPYGTKGSTRPDFYNPKTKTSIEVKNYDVSTPAGRNRLTSNIGEQAKKRAKNLPPGSTQKVELDVRGQQLDKKTTDRLIEKINQRSGGLIKPEDVAIRR